MLAEPLSPEHSVVFNGDQTVEWRVEPGLVPYEAAVQAMEARVAAIA